MSDPAVSHAKKSKEMEEQLDIIWLAFRGSSWLPLKEVHVCVRVHLQILDSTQTRLIFLARNTSKSRKEIFKIQAIS